MALNIELHLKVNAIIFNGKDALTPSNMLKQKLHHFCNRSSPDDGPKSGRKY